MTNYQYRDAQTGEFVTQEYAEAHPDVTVREEDVVKHDTPDILTLQARVHQLEAALQGIIDAQEIDCTCHETENIRLGEGCISCSLCMNAQHVLSAPTPDTSPLWELLRLNLSLEQGEGDRAWAKAMNALTPEQRALIAEMSGSRNE